MIVLSGADLVLPDRILAPGTLVVDGDRIVDVRAGGSSPHPHPAFAFHGHYVVPGFVDVHVHGVGGVDSLDGGGAIAKVAALLPQFGVTAFCPTTVACGPERLRDVLEQVRRARAEPLPGSARVLPAHLESNFVNPEYCGAQPPACLRSPRAAMVGGEPNAAEFSAADILREIERATPDVGIVTMAPELEGGLDLIRWLSAKGLRVSLGHSGADYETALAAIAAGAHHATHLFNRMPPLAHRAPGLAGAVLQTDEIAAELICDNHHVHPAMIRTAIAAKRVARVMAITDATAVAGLPSGSRAMLGGRPIVAGGRFARLDDGTLAGSLLTMDVAFRNLTGEIGLSLVDAATLCSTTPARELGLVGHGVLAPEAVADFVVLDRNLTVVQTYIGGRLAYTRASPSGSDTAEAGSRFR